MHGTHWWGREAWRVGRGAFRQLMLQEERTEALLTSHTNTFQIYKALKYEK